MTTDRQEISPETYVLADAIAATSPQRRLLTTLGIRRNGAGALPALRTAARAVASAEALSPSARADRWLAILRVLVTSVTSASTKAPWLDMLCPAIGHRAVGDVLANPTRCALPEQARARLDAWLGLHVFHALTRGGVVSVSALEDWETLRRTGTPRASSSAPWITAAQCMPLTEPEINSMLSATRNARLQDALRSSLAALAADIPDPSALGNSIETDALTGHPTDAGSSGSDEASDDEDVEDSESTETDAPDASLSLIGLLLHRGVHAGYRGQFGVTSIYGELPPQNLKHVCTALMRTLATGTAADRTKAAFAEVSLKVPLSPRRTLTVPLACGDDVWLDIPNRALCWNFDRVLSPRECDPNGADHQGRCKPIRIRLSDACISHLSELLTAQPTARSLRELVGVDSDDSAVTAWLKGYGLFLRSHGDDNYRAYSVRFARSYRSVYLDRNHGAVAAALLGLDFATAPAGLLHYVSLPPDRVTEWQMDVDRYLGLRWTSESAAGAQT